MSPLRLPHLPAHEAGMRIGLLGGTFNPAHAGHLLASHVALTRLQLDRVWWLVTPGNPLKENSGLPPFEERMALARVEASADTRIAVSDIELRIGTRFTFDTVAFLKRRCPRAHFVWIMGADNLARFHHWRKWRELAALVPIAVIDRPGSTLKGAHSRAAIALARSRIDEVDARRLAVMTPPALLFLHGPRSDLSSTALRQGAGKNLAEDAAPDSKR